ncbi:MAG TPA: hypothetical protein VGX78_14290 [Pirellulales bacterium]|jgi:hypothetical protein|nr:hypothetical protein [Pirellulales bacterium]
MSFAKGIRALLHAGFKAATVIGAIWASSFAQSPTALGAHPIKIISTREAREDAVRAIPYAKLGRSARAKVSNVLSATTLYRRMPSQRVDCDPALFEFVIEHPDLIVNIWQILGISEVTVDRLDQNRFEADDKAGTLGHIDFLHKSPTLHLLLAEGAYEGPLFGRPVRGKVLLLIRSSEAGQADGRKFVRCRLDAFLQLDNLGAGMLAKTFQPLVGAAADHNFQETVKFLGALNRAAEANPAAMRKMAEKLEHVEPDDREEFSALTDQLAANAAQLATAKAKRRSDEAARTARRPAAKQTAPMAGKPAKSTTKPHVDAAAPSPSSRRVP